MNLPNQISPPFASDTQGLEQVIKYVIYIYIYIYIYI